MNNINIIKSYLIKFNIIKVDSEQYREGKMKRILRKQ